MKKTLALFVGLALAGGVYAAEVPLPKDLPVYAAEKPLPPLEITQQRLANGLTVWVVPRPGIPKVTANLVILGGNAADPVDAPAISDLLGKLINEGTSTRSSQQLAEQWQAIGGDFGVSTGPDSITLIATALASHADTMMTLLADIGLHPSFPDAEVALGKANALQELKANEADPAWQAERAFASTLYGTHPYARGTPTEASIQAASSASMHREYARRFRPDRGLLVIVGRIEPAAALALAKQQFGGWKATGTPIAETPEVPRSHEPLRVLVQRDGSVQSAIRMGSPAVPSADPDYIPLSVANVIFGGSFNSRLTVDIREDKGYTYSPYSAVTPLRAGGEFLASAEVRNEVTGPTLTEMGKVLAGMASQAPSDEELTGAKRLLGGLYLLRVQQQRALAGTLSSAWVRKLPPEYVTTYVVKTGQVTADQVTAMAAKYFDPAKQSVVIVGDEKAIDAQLKPFGAFTVTKP